MPAVKLWTVNLPWDFDVEQFASDLLTEAQENLKNDGFLQAAAFVISATEMRCFEISFQGYEDKHATYAQVVQEAHALQATAIVTLNDTYVGDKYDPETYRWGDVAKNPKGEMIMVTISGPSIENITIEAPYFRGPTGISFGANEQERGTVLGILPGWATSKGERIN